MNKRPNILLITTDQQRFDTIHASGYDQMITPNLDRIANEGGNFLNAYSPNPVCIPARHNIITGLPCKYHTFDDNYFDDSHVIPYDLPTFAQCLSDEGYDTIAIGKMHFQPARRHNGFGRFIMTDEISRFREDDDYLLYLKEKGYKVQSPHGVRHVLYMQPQQSLLKDEDHASSWIATKTIEYLDNSSRNRPFLIWAGFVAPHPPFNVPHSYAHLYDDADIPEPIVSKTPVSIEAENNKYIADYPNKETYLRAKQSYYSSISFVDHNVGRILDKLEEIGEIDNTLIIFTSDHGEMFGDMGTYQKMLPYDGSCKIPFLVRFPKEIKAGTKITDFVDLNDIFPTMLDVAGIKYPGKELPGGSIFKDDKDRNFQYVEHQHGQRRWLSVRTKEYKYNYYYALGREELFDMVNDPKETTNLLYDDPKGYEEIRLPLRKKLLEYEIKWGLSEGIENGDFKVYPELKPHFTMENNPPVFPKNLREPEDLISLEDEVKMAIADEPVVDLENLNLDYYAKTLDIEDLLTKKQ